jgi:hypothetical protein
MWKGLARYRDTATTVTKEDREYAKVTTLLDSAALDFSYFADTPGLYDGENSAPEYGMDIVIHGGIVKYGPWADRQRDALQKAFAPSIFFDSEPRPPLKPGDIRVHTAVIVTLALSEETTLRMPTREPSKVCPPLVFR